MLNQSSHKHKRFLSRQFCTIWVMVMLNKLEKIWLFIQLLYLIFLENGQCCKGLFNDSVLGDILSATGTLFNTNTGGLSSKPIHKYFKRDFLLFFTIFNKSFSENTACHVKTLLMVYFGNCKCFRYQVHNTIWICTWKPATRCMTFMNPVSNKCTI